MRVALPVIPSQVEESRCKIQSYFYGIFDSASLRSGMTVILILSQIEIAARRLR